MISAARLVRSHPSLVAATAAAPECSCPTRNPETVPGPCSSGQCPGSREIVPCAPYRQVPGVPPCERRGCVPNPCTLAAAHGPHRARSPAWRRPCPIGLPRKLLDCWRRPRNARRTIDTTRPPAQPLAHDQVDALAALCLPNGFDALLDFSCPLVKLLLSN